MKFCSHQRRHGERGYILLVLLLAVALLSIASLTLVQSMEFRIRRDREEELIHRGVQYSRAIQRFYKKFGRYPTSISDLEDTNNIRFLRHRYTDPMNRDPKTGKERPFKLLHLQDIQASFNNPGAGLTSVSDLANQQAGAPGALNAPTRGGGAFGPGAIGGTQTTQTATSDTSQTGQNTSADATPGTEKDTNQNTDENTASDSGAPPPQPLSQQMGPNGAPQVLGGGAIVGVASASKAKTIREFNKKDHYNQWQFIYDPTMDRGGLLMTPNQPPLQGAAAPVNQQQNGMGGVNGQPAFNGQNPGGLGNQMPTQQPSQPTSPAPDQQQ